MEGEIAVSSDSPNAVLDDLSLNKKDESNIKLKTTVAYIIAFLVLIFIAATTLTHYFFLRNENYTGNLKDRLTDRVEYTHWVKPSFKTPAHDEVYRALKSEIVSSGIDIISGPFDACLTKGWKVNCLDGENNIRGVLEWELNIVAFILATEKNSVNIKDELQSILAHKQFSIVNGINYTNEDEFTQRYYNFRDNRKMIETHNSKADRSYDKGYSWASEYSEEDTGMAILQGSSGQNMLYRYVDGKFINTQDISPLYKANGDEIILKDWRDENVVSPVINQGVCGACWAIATASLIDSYRAIKTGKLVVHSPQHLLDCTASRFNCVVGGNHEVALKFVIDNGICPTDNYPYFATKMICKAHQCLEKYKVENMVKLDEHTIEDHLNNHGPVLAAIKLSRDFMQYAGGIFDGSCRARLSHSILIVGYGRNTRTGKEFWIIKNSWGVKWGYDGYFKLSRMRTREFTRPDTFCNVSTHAFGLRVK
ncbi:cysteine proteinases like protein [Babesia gibsoni]|uniref:Cysteine proteinases like protein n=1 Tax=Babesia gibsoni TaxID=33632 RepID=A0AAD8PEM0_BABGI|nr:cysteine proteinases like protein [Babesia gibsoni]